MQFVIAGLKKTSLLDYPDKVSAIVFTQGCNFRCGYCHNPDLLEVNSKKDICSTDVFFEFLKKRKGILDGVVITGGEPTLQKDLIPFIKAVKKQGYLVKLDTNGSNPHVLEKLLNLHLIDYVAMDIKAPLSKYKEVVCVNVDTSKIQKSINQLFNSDIDFEFRTTVMKSQLGYEDFRKIGELIKNAPRYYLQKFEAKTKIQDENLANEKTYSNAEFDEIIEILKQNIKIVELR